jgi:2-(1,2-epoxy-1,2-dihydrophenyl)acetyl-CoA isomerase
VTASTYRCIAFAIDDEGVARLTLDRSDKLNPIDGELMREIANALSRVRADTRVRALSIDSTGKVFSAGGSLDRMASGGSELRGTESRGARIAQEMKTVVNPTILALQDLPVPVIVAVQGPAVGAGVGLALAGDITIAARSAYFYLPFIPKLGIVPDTGSAWFVHRAIGWARAQALILGGDKLGAEEAHRMGLIARCVDDAALAGEAAKLARSLAKLPANAALEARRIGTVAQEQGLRAVLEHEVARQGELIDSPAFDEGVRAFMQRREPVFAGRRDPVD